MRPFYSIAFSVLVIVGCGTGEGPVLPEPLNYSGADSEEAPPPYPPNNAEAIPSSEGTFPRAEKEPPLPSLIPAPAPVPAPDNISKNNPPAPTPVPPAPQEPAPPPPPPAPEPPLPPPPPEIPEPVEEVPEPVEETPEPVQGPDVIDEDGRPVLVPEVISTPEDPVQPSQQQFAAMLETGKVVSRYDIEDADSWGTSRNRRIEVFVAVDGAGRPLVPRDVRDTQVDGGLIGFFDDLFERNNGRPVLSIHSVLKICNRSPRDLLLRTTVGQPLASAKRRIDVGECAQFLVENVKGFVDGQSVEANGNSRTNIFFKLTKVDLNGRIVP